MKARIRIFLFGILTWLIPFVFAIPFYSKEGVPQIDIFFLKSLLIVVGALTGAVFLIPTFKKINDNFIANSCFIGFVWLSMNWLLDILILIPLAQMTFEDYFLQIGIRYLIIPITSITLGIVLKGKVSSSG